ncbi:MAG: family 20 glycosylhydrolase [Bacteroidales bacterium]|nr:family 20 glycosylhydrolase [Bacteroidales bacterium]
MMLKLITLILALVPQLLPVPAKMQVRDGSFKVDGEKRMQWVLDPACALPPEGYTLDITRGRVRALASTETGLFYAKQTLKQLEQNGFLPCCTITDYPRFAWRGFHIDPCRHFMPVEEVKKQIDILASYKMNVMHWHLTDDQGWRIEIKRYPPLRDVGGTRTEFDGSVHQGCYTQEEIRDVVAYAAERHVTVVPEIEMPGHAIAAIRAFPELSCTGEAISTFYTWGSPNIVMCPGKDLMFEFLDNVIAEVVDLFPSEYIHIGGDECKKDKWIKCPRCQERIKALGLVADENGTAEEKLQSYAVRRMENILAKYGKKLIGWDEILEGGLSPNATVMSWRGEEGGIAAALQGHDVIMTPSKEGMYLDHVQGDPKIEPVSIGNYTTMEKAYNYDPVPEELVKNGMDNYVIGLQCNLWSEYIYSDDHRNYMLFPRAFAVAETGWSLKENKDWESFRVRVDRACQDLDSRGVNYHIPLPEQPGGSCDNIAFIDKAVLEFTTTRPMAAIVYTTDDTEPTVASAAYERPLEFTESATLKIASVTPYGKLSPVRTINIAKQQPWPAVAKASEGLKAWRADGRFVSAADLEGARWNEIKLEKLRDMTTLEPFDRNMPDTLRFYAVKAQGSFKVKETGVYRFSSDCDQVWIDGKLLIDNGAEVKRFSRHDAEAALEAGAHDVQVIYIYNVVGGWNSIRNKTDVQMRKEGSEKWRKIEIL